MIRLFFITILALGPLGVWAQTQDQLEKIEAARIALITERLELTPEQAEKFWPVYREFADQRRGILQDLQQIRQQSAREGISEEERKEMIDKAYALRQRELNLEKDYSERLMRVISARQLTSLRKAEADFTRMLLERIEQKRDQQMRRDEMRDRREEYLKEKRGN